MSRLKEFPTHLLDPEVVRQAEVDVERLFKEDHLWGGKAYRNPVTDTLYIKVPREVKREKAEARQALLAREWFRIHGPHDAQPLPVSPCERCKSHSLIAYITTLYARSLRGRDNDVTEHPPFADYVRGVLWEAELAEGGFVSSCYFPIEEMRALKKRYPPRMLKGMGPGACWEPPDIHRKTINELRNSCWESTREVPWFYRA